MKELLVISGKGGTGKTCFTASFAALAENKLLADLDVDAANLHLLLSPQTKETHEFWSGQVAVIDEAKCSDCGLCREQCRFDAITEKHVDPIACEGCGFCAHICPEKAISMIDTMSGHWFISDTNYGMMVHARLGIAQENSGKLIALIRKEARQLAEQKGLDIVISDGPPGIGCPVISSLSGVDLALIVTEPTLSGIHDMERVLELCEHFSVPAQVCVNKYDINEDNTKRIAQFCREQGLPTPTLVPYDNAMNEALAKGIPVVNYTQNGVAAKITALWESLAGELLTAKP